jgi:protein-disulfide isomerase
MSISKREEIRAQRLQKQRKQRMATMVGTGVVILVVVLLIGLPSVIDKYRPAGEFISITPMARPLAEGLAVGNPNAPVVIEVFADFQCSACKVFSQTTEEQLLATDYIANGQVYYIFRQYPFLDDRTAIKMSDQAANASMCAMEQGRFWDYHTMLFVNQNTSSAVAFSDRRLVAFADDLGLDVDIFNECFKANTYSGEIQADIDRGQAYGISGTPSIFLNGQRIGLGNSVPSYEDILTAIDAALAFGN